MGSAPTDDENGRLSRLELANGGTLFLEKIEYLAPELHQVAGNLAMPGFTAPKLLCVRRHEPQHFQRTATVLLPKDYLRYRMTGKKVSDMSDAAGTLFGWTSVARIARGAVMEAKNLEFNTASTALGSTPIRNLFRHILPNSLAPIIVVGTTSLATYIVLEATLSFLGVGLPTTTVSWGGDISNAQSILRTDPMVLFYPSAALAITVLAFIMMGDAVKDALDPKSRTA